jgi:hypothetical protein
MQVDAGGLRAGGQATLVAGGASAADLTVELKPGAFLAEGLVTGKVRLEDRRGSGPWVDADLVARNALLPGEGISIVAGRLSAQGPLSRLPFELTARGRHRAAALAKKRGTFMSRLVDRVPAEDRLAFSRSIDLLLGLLVPQPPADGPRACRFCDVDGCGPECPVPKHAPGFAG